MGTDDPMMKFLMTKIESVLVEAAYVREQKPVTWLKFCDGLKAEKARTHIPYQEAVAQAQAIGIPAKDVKYLLEFLRDMGILMWYDDDGLRDVVILDPFEFFIRAATTVICKLVTTEDDPTLHVTEVHKRCQKSHQAAWSDFMDRAVLDYDLLLALLQEWRDSATTIIRLMVKFGLLVSVVDCEDDRAEVEPTYLVPVLLPIATTSCFEGFETSSTCLFAFSVSKYFETHAKYLTSDQIAKFGFLPAGFFSRLLGKLVTASLVTSNINIVALKLSRNEALLIFGNQQFFIRECPEAKTLVLHIEGGNPMAVQRRVGDLIQVECVLYTA